MNYAWQQRSNPHKLELMDRYIEGNKVLELGAGYGWYSAHLHEQGKEVLAVDLENNLPSEQIPFLKHDLEKPLPFKGPGFEAILAWDVIEHVENEQQLLSEIYRCLKPGGVLLMSVPNANDETLINYHITYSHFKDKTHKREYEIEGLKKKLEDQKFRIVDLHLWGGQMIPYIVLEFIRPPSLRIFAKILLKVMRKLRVLDIKDAHNDIYVVLRRGS